MVTNRVFRWACSLAAFLFVVLAASAPADAARRHQLGIGESGEIAVAAFEEYIEARDALELVHVVESSWEQEYEKTRSRRDLLGQARVTMGQSSLLFGFRISDAITAELDLMLVDLDKTLENQADNRPRYPKVQAEYDQARLNYSAATYTLAAKVVEVSGLESSETFALAAEWMNADDDRQIAVFTALAQAGRRYVFAGKGPHVFDCSGLTSFAWEKAGKPLPSHSHSQREMLPEIEADEVLPGDLAFWWNASGGGHVAMMLGYKDLVIEALDSRSGVLAGPLNTRTPDSYARLWLPWQGAEHPIL